MKTVLLRLVCAIASVLCLWSVTAAAQSGYGHLTVKRAANYGQNMDLVVFIDGRQVDRLSFGQTYDGKLNAGPHEVTIGVSGDMKKGPATTHLVVTSGNRYLLTGGFNGLQLVFK